MLSFPCSPSCFAEVAKNDYSRATAANPGESRCFYSKLIQNCSFAKKSLSHKLHKARKLQGKPKTRLCAAHMESPHAHTKGTSKVNHPGHNGSLWT